MEFIKKTTESKINKKNQSLENFERTISQIALERWLYCYYHYYWIKK